MSNVNIICDNCGRWVQGITWVNGMKFCAKCYQETFGASKDWQLLDKDKTIADLEAKLAESEKKLKDMDNSWTKEVRELEDEIEQLKQQLAEKEHSIEMLNQHLTDKAIEIERLGEELKELQEYHDKYPYSYSEEYMLNNKELKQQFAEKEKEINKWKDGTIIVKLCELEKQIEDKDKEIEKIKQVVVDKEELIMFADRTIKGLLLAKEIDKIELLEKVKDRLKTFKHNYNGAIDCCETDIFDIIDTLISEIKGGGDE